MSDRTIPVGLAGFGMSGQVFHAPFISADPRFTLKKVYERTTDKAKQLDITVFLLKLIQP